MRGEFVDVAGVRLYYYAAGTRGGGDPVLLVHGFAMSANLWRQLVPLVPAGHRVIAVDLAGHGRSDTLDGDGDLGATAHASLIRGLLDELRAGPVNAVAHGFGCEVAIELARDTSRVRAALFVSPAGSGQRVPAVPAPRSAAALALRLPWGAPATAPIGRYLSRGFANPATAAHSIPRHLQPFRIRSRRATLIQQLQSLAASRAGEIDVQQPFELVVGGDDPFVSARTVASRFLRDGGGTLTLLGGERHFLPEEAPETIARLLARLLGR